MYTVHCVGRFFFLRGIENAVGLMKFGGAGGDESESSQDENLFPKK